LEASFLKQTIIPKETMGLKVSKKLEDMQKVISSLLMQPKALNYCESERKVRNPYMILKYPHQKKRF
jgi:hypothetical protein